MYSSLILIVAVALSALFMMTTTPPPTKQWADAPLSMVATPLFTTKKKDMFTVGASHMGNMHNSIFRGYNSIYHQAPHVLDVDKAGFVGYCLTWYKFVKTHADDEEATLFPKVEDLLDDKGIWEDTHKEHDAFIPLLAEFHKYLTSLKSPTEFAGAELIKVMNSFQKPFEDHFRSEVATIAKLAEHPNAPKEGTPEEEAAGKVFKDWGKSTVSKAGMTDVLPFFLYNLDHGYEDGLWANWPPIPAPIKWMLTNAGGLLHWSWWKFASCDGAGKPRELYALQFEEAK